MADKKKYWRGIAELENPGLTETLGKNEFPEKLPTDKFLGNKESLESSNTSRRDFLKYMGFTTAAATLAACESPVVESIPYAVAPEEVIPGIANYYATSYFDGHDFASILLKTREGRPIKVENNKLAKYNGGANTRVHASVLSLYDDTRLKKPLVNGEETSWDSLDSGVKAGLEKAQAEGKQIVLLTGTVMSPSTKMLVKKFAAKYSNVRHVSVDEYSYSNKLDAYQKDTGKRALPTYKFDEARVVVSFGADFLGDWTGQRVSGDFSKTRVPGENMSYHAQFEANMSLTGANADQRYKASYAQQGLELIALHNAIAKAKGLPILAGGKSIYPKQIDKLAQELIKAGKHGLVVSGANDEDRERIVIAINKMLDNDGTTLSYSTRAYFRQGNDANMKAILADMQKGKVGAVIVHNVNPAYSASASSKFAEAYAKVPTRVAISQKNDETATLSNYVACEHHAYESWGDYMPVDNYYTIQQPAIQPLFKTRQMEECLMAWAGVEGSYLNFLQSNWQAGILGSDRNWKQAVHDGVYAASGMNLGSDMTAESTSTQDLTPEANDGASASLESAARRISKAANSAKGMEINFYQKVGMGTGNMANNPWLQEFSDPITRVSWDNYLTISAADALELGIQNWAESNGAINGSKVNLTVNGQPLKDVPVWVQPGQAKGTLGLAVGYGRDLAGPVAKGVGVNAFPAMNGSHVATAEVSPIEGSEHQYACIQLASTMMGRDIVKETDLNTFLNRPASSPSGDGWNEKPVFETYAGPMGADKANLWDDFDHETGHMWNMSIDLNLCDGCGACVIACQSENNVPVVGKEEVRKFRDMQWLRIDRYFSSDTTEETAAEADISAFEKYADMEVPSESPQVYFQPVMCQHCNHAPCETVCPVAATTHSAEGLNHMTYNRCIGTRYCANNCPYKVRRFNWFQYYDNAENFGSNYAMNDDLGRMVLNPDVTVRSRGVMEKCSMCIQRIQLGKLEAKVNGEPLKDGQVQTACQSACDSNAIVFGDVNNKESAVFKLKHEPRMYHLLEEVGTQPSVFYQVKVRNNKG